MFFRLWAVSVLCWGCSAHKPEDEDVSPDDVSVSAKCAAVLLASTTTLGAGAIYAATPVALCTAGFCAPGVASGSFAAWWQSTIHVVVKGSLFAKLQAVAMGGAGMKTVVASAAVGGAVGASYLSAFCTYVDDASPASAMGHVFDTSLTLVTSASEAQQTVQAHCAASETCKAVVEAGASTVTSISSGISSMFGSLTTAVSNGASAARLHWEIIQLKREIDEQKSQFGARVFDYMREAVWAHTALEMIFDDSFGKVSVLESQIREKEAELRNFS